MGDLNVTVPSVATPIISGILDNGTTDLMVAHEDRACLPCLGNTDPSHLPFPGCRGNNAPWMSKALGDDPDGDGDDKDKISQTSGTCSAQGPTGRCS